MELPQEIFYLNASIERVFQYSRCRFNSGSARIITAELVARLHPPGSKNKVATAIDMTKGGWKWHPDLVYSVLREAVETWETVE